MQELFKLRCTMCLSIGFYFSIVLIRSYWIVQALKIAANQVEIDFQI